MIRSRYLVLGASVLVALMVQSFHSSSVAQSAGTSRTVALSVAVTDKSGGRLHYRWRSSDGAITNVDAPTTTWALPPGGPGVHFAYVMVSNGMGGYTQRRIAVITDSLPPAPGYTVAAASANRLRPPPGAAQRGDYFKGYIETAGYTEPNGNPRAVYEPNVLVHLQDPNNSAIRFPANRDVVTDYKGQYVIAGVPANGAYEAHCSIPSLGIADQLCAYETTLPDSATPDYFPGYAAVDATGTQYVPWVGGALHLADGSPCGVQDEFFNVHATATATLLSAAPGYKVLAGPVPVNEFGDFALPYRAGAALVRLRCEGAAPLIVGFAADPASGDYNAGTSVLSTAQAPLVTDMSATLNGAPVGKFLPPPSGFASDVLSRNDGFLTSKGIDSRRGACQYYRAIGAVQDCDDNGNFKGTVLTYDDWQRSVRIGPYVRTGTRQYSANFINRADLNLARQHVSVSYGPQQTAAVVCNHLGPPANDPQQLLNPSQADIDTAVLNAVANKNLVACVAMDYFAYAGVNGGKPFVRFMIFGPDGSLLPSVNLDGRAEKFVPGTCVVCHGGSHYQGKYPENGSGFADIGAHFLPYDTGNFEFANAPGLTAPEQEESIYRLNQNVLNTGPTVAEQELIAGWYPGGSHALDLNYIPSSWITPSVVQPSSTVTDFYTKVMARSCRGCHVSQIEAYNFDHEYNIDQLADVFTVPPRSPLFADPNYEFVRSICGGKRGIQRDHMMPNSLVTFNRFWASAGTGDDQLAYLNAYFAYTESLTGDGDACGTQPFPE